MTAGPWHLLTGEYPPQPGGVGDYTAHLAAGLAAAGAEVHVWAVSESDDGPAAAVAGVTVHRLAEGPSAAGLERLSAALDAFPAPRRLLVQYTPNSWGRRGLNFGFCRWVAGRGRRDDVRLMFHEVCYPWELREKPARWALAAGQRWMARTLLQAGSSVYVSIPEWKRLLRACGLKAGRPAVWLPVPSNIPVVADAGAVAALRRRLAPRGETIVASFGTYGEAVGGLLRSALPELMGGHRERVGVLIGRGGEAFAAGLSLDGLTATGSLPPAEVSLYLQACDVLIQPYPDGVSSRRTTVMAGLAHGRPVATNRGRFTEPVWAASGAVALAPEADAVARVAESLLADSEARDRLGAAARAAYERHFTWERTVERLLQGEDRRANGGRQPAGSSDSPAG